MNDQAELSSDNQSFSTVEQIRKPDIGQRFLDLFSPNVNGYGKTYAKYKDGEPVIKDSGKHDSKSTFVDEPLTAEHINKHLTAGPDQWAYGASPLRADGTVRFIVIDIDDYKMSHAEIIGRVQTLDLQIALVTSKSAGLHGYVFFSHDVQPAEAQELGRRYVTALCLSPKTELFPKQKTIGKFPNWINLPYAGALCSPSPCVRTGYDDNGQLIPFVEDWIKYANSKRVSIADAEAIELPFEDGPPCLQSVILDRLGEDTGRNNALFNMAVYAKQKYEDWQGHVEEYNESFAVPLRQLTMLKSLESGEYFYKCEDKPCAEYCNKELCKKRPFGVGSKKLGYDELMVKLGADHSNWIEDCRAAQLSPIEFDQVTQWIKAKFTNEGLPVRIQAVRDEITVPLETEPTAFETTQRGELLESYHNARVAIMKLGLPCSYDAFHDQMLIGGHHMQEYAGDLTDAAAAMLRQLIIDQFGVDCGKQNVLDAVAQLCLANRFDPVLNYLNSLKWDGVKRLDNWQSVYLSAPDDELTSAIGKIMLVGAVRRVRKPGCKFDTMVVWEGPQGQGKSSALEFLAGKDNYSDQGILGVNDREQQEHLKGVWIYEVCELQGLRKSDVGKVKAFTSRTEDRARPAYGRFLVRQPRRCIFVGTTNEQHYLQDQTGNRRFLPVRTGEIDLVKLRQDRDQLWAEAAHMEAKGGSITLPSELWEKSAQRQQGRLELDPWEAILEDTLHGAERVHTADLFGEHVLGIPVVQQTGIAARRVAAIMRRQGWVGPKDYRIGDRVGKGYVRGRGLKVFRESF